MVCQGGVVHGIGTRFLGSDFELGSKRQRRMVSRYLLSTFIGIKQAITSDDNSGRQHDEGNGLC
jgi:hypothetical protein